MRPYVFSYHLSAGKELHEIFEYISHHPSGVEIAHIFVLVPLRLLEVLNSVQNAGPPFPDHFARSIDHYSSFLTAPTCCAGLILRIKGVRILKTIRAAPQLLRFTMLSAAQGRYHS